MVLMITCSARKVILWCTFSFPLFSLCYARDSIAANQPIRDSRNETLVSAGEIFELGFFTPQGSSDTTSSDNRRYLGIWYRNRTISKRRVVVWVANRANPLTSTNGVFSVTENGHLELTDESNGIKYWSENVGAQKPKLSLADTGNLALFDEGGNRSEVRWQSFLQPTDTFLPGMKMADGIQLTSWKSQDDPSPGDFTFETDPDRENQYIIQKGVLNDPYWRSETSGNSQFSFDDISPVISDWLSNFSSPTPPPKATGKRGSYDFSSGTRVLKAPDFVNTLLVMNFTGQIQFIKWEDGVKEGLVIRSEPRDRCRVLNACGVFSSCNSMNYVPCRCLPGFEPKDSTGWSSGDFSGGCERKANLCSEGEAERSFLKLKMVKVGKRGKSAEAENEDECKTQCLDCHCDAYSYTNDSLRAATCWIWEGGQGLNTIQEDYMHIDHLEINVHVLLSDVGKRSVCSLSMNNI